MLTRQHYKAIAAIIKENTSHVNPQFLFIPTQELVEFLSNYFTTDNPNFDRDKFLAACGLKD